MRCSPASFAPDQGGVNPAMAKFRVRFVTEMTMK
jgi:hypothetical protein